MWSHYKLFLIHPTFLLVQLPEGYQDCFIQVESRKGFYIAKGNTTHQQSWVEPIIWNSSVKQHELDVLTIEQEIVERRRRTDLLGSNGHRYKRINKMAKHKMYGKFRQSVEAYLPFNDPVVSCKTK